MGCCFRGFLTSIPRGWVGTHRLLGWTKNNETCARESHYQLDSTAWSSHNGDPKIPKCQIVWDRRELHIHIRHLTWLQHIRIIRRSSWYNISRWAIVRKLTMLVKPISDSPWNRIVYPWCPSIIPMKHHANPNMQLNSKHHMIRKWEDPNN